MQSLNFELTIRTSNLDTVPSPSNQFCWFHLSKRDLTGIAIEKVDLKDLMC